ncbi:TPA: DUF5677 domain-containing protein [Legionella pneumophila]|nr:hypothetical protein [Legionella pneumophila]
MFPLPSVDFEELLLECRKKNKYGNVLFEYYRYVGQLLSTAMKIEFKSPAIRNIEINEFAILIGLLNRIVRLMLSNMKLSSDGTQGETTAILDRCILESCVKLIWLCQNKQVMSFNRFIADGLKADLKLKGNILSNIQQRNGKELPVEKRMLNSIEKYIQDSGLTEDDIANSKRLPDMASMLKSIKVADVYYVVIMNMGSHSVHGTWSSLKKDYFIIEDGSVYPQDHLTPTHVNQLISVSIMALYAMKAFFNHILDNDEDLLNEISLLSDEIIEKIVEIYHEKELKID